MVTGNFACRDRCGTAPTWPGAAAGDTALLLAVGEITCGKEVTAQDPAATIRTAVATPTAGRSQPTHRAEPIAARPGPAWAQVSNRRAASQRPGPAASRTAILARILASPSAPGLTRSATARSSPRSLASCSRGQGPGLRWVTYSRSRWERSAAIAREVWLLTAPLVMPMAEAIWASVRSA